MAPPSTSQELRDLAEWYRNFAALAGGEIERRRRLEHAEYLERRASELEQPKNLQGDRD